MENAPPRLETSAPRAGSSPQEAFAGKGSAAPLVTAIVSTYASAGYLRGRLENLLSQTLGDRLEVVVVDSCSPENDADIAREYASRDPRVRVVRTSERETIYKAWNRGVEMARGKYLTNANADDILRVDALERLAAELDSHPGIDLAYGDFWITHEPNQTFLGSRKIGYSLKPEFDRSIMLSGCHMGPQPMWRKSLHDRFGLFDPDFHAAGDYEFWCRCAAGGAVFRHVPEFLGLYLHNQAGLCNGDVPRVVRESAEIQSRYRDKLPPAPAAFRAEGFYRKEPLPENAGFVNIGMVTWNRLEFTKQAIEAVWRKTRHPHVLTVVDNGSTDGTREWLEEMHRQGAISNLILLPENVGVAKASNLAWSRVPDATHYLKLDNDIVLGKDGWLDEMVRVVDAIPEVGAVAYSFEPISFPVVEIRGVRVRPKNGNLGGACILIPDRIRQLLGVWSEDYGFYGEEDLDYGFRVQITGMLNAYMEDEDVGFHLPAGKAAVIDTGTWLAADGKEEVVHAEYRLMKDRSRARNHQSGIVEANFKAYLDGSKSRKVESVFAREYEARQLQAEKPLSLLVCSMNPPSNCCAHLRVLQHLRQDPSIRTHWTAESRPSPAFTRALGAAEIVLVQRGYVANPEAMEAIRRSGKPWVLEMDDLLWEDLPPSNPHALEFREAAPLLVAALRDCDAAIASTVKLGEAMERFTSDVHVVPNLLDPRLWPDSTAAGNAEPVVIAYAGTATHSADLALVESALERISKVHGNKVSFLFLGCATPRLLALPDARVSGFSDDYAAYAKTLLGSGVHIALAPLEDHPFNRAKSAIKWLEYSACRAAGIYSDLPPYQDTVRDGENGFLAGADPDVWFDRIDRMVRDPGLRNRIAEAAYGQVRSRYMLDPTSSPLGRALRTIHAESRHGALRKPILSQPRPHVSIVIPVHGHLDLTRQCLEAVRRTTDPSTTEIVVVDDASPDGTAAWLREQESDGTLKAIFLSPNRGFATACNAGAKAASGKTLVFLNNDTIPEAEWLDALVRTLEENPSAGMVGSRLLYPNRTIQHAGIHFQPGGMPFHVHRGLPADDPSVLVAKAFPAVTGACIAIPSDLFGKLGGFDESFHMYVEDVDLCIKVWDAGREVLYCPDSVVVHLESASASDLERRDVQVREGLGKLHARWSGRWPRALSGMDGFPPSFLAQVVPSRDTAKVLWISPIWDPSGYGDESRAFLGHLAATDIGLSTRAWGRHSETFHQNADAPLRALLDPLLDTPVREGGPVVLDMPGSALGRVQGAGHHVGRTTFETDGLPPEWVDRCNSMDEVWVPSRFNSATFSKAGVTKPVLVVPEGVDTNKFRPGLQPLEIPGPKMGTTFLSVFEWTHRKGPDVLLRAWARAFGPDDDVRLVLRTYPPNEIEGDPARWVDAKIEETLREAGSSRSRCAPILVIARQVPDADMPRLYAAADVYLAPSRGEGWGRPHMEAMSCGVPVVATRWSGNLDFQDDNNSWLVDVEGLEEIDAKEEFPFYRGQKWAKPSVDHLSRLLKTALDPDPRRAKGARARQDMVARWDWSLIAPVAEARIREILAGVPASSSTLHPSPGRLPPPAPEAGTSLPVVRWCGDLFNFSGYAGLARNAVAGLMDAGIPVTADPQRNDRNWFPGISPADRTRWTDLLSRAPLPGVLVCSDVPRDATGRNQPFDQMAAANPGNPKRVGWTMFESDRLPAGWADSLNRLDEVWVPSEFNRRTFSAAGVDPARIHVVPGSVDASRYGFGLPFPLPGSRKGTTFLSVFQWARRKGWDVLLRAWAEAFEPQADVRLVLRCHPFGKDAPPMRDRFLASLEELGLSEAKMAPIVLLDGFVSESEMPSLYLASDVFVLPSRGEGWGLPYLEAMASGKPCIATAWGASMDFLNEENAWLASPRDTVSVGEAACRENPYLSPDHRWADPDPREVAQLLRRAASNIVERERKGIQARFEASTRWNPATTAAAIASRSRALLGIPEPATNGNRPRVLSASGTKLSGAMQKVAEGLLARGGKQAPATPVESEKTLSIRWEGSQFVHHSLALVNRELCLRLAKRGHDLSLIPWEADQFGPGEDQNLTILARLRKAPLEGPCEVHVRHQWPPLLEPPEEGKWVVVQPWEFGSPPADWMPAFRDRIDALWVPSTYCRDLYARAGVPQDRIRVVPNGVDTDRFRPGLQPLPGLEPDGRITFLYVGGTIARKGFDVLLNAWKKAFGPSDPVRLLVKAMGGDTFYKGQTGEAMVDEINASCTCAPIHYIDSDLSLDDLPRIYASGDVLVHPYRGEGFGLPIAEAMSCGLPVVVTRGGASDDFCGEAESWGIPATRVDVPGGVVGPFRTVSAPWWLEPSVDGLADILREAAQDEPGRRARGRAGRKRILSNWTWDHAADAAEAALLDVVRRPGDRRDRTEANPSDAPMPNATTESELLDLNRILFRAEAAAGRGEFDEAEAATREAVEAHPDQHLAWLARAMVLRGLRKFPSSIEAVQKSIALRESPDALLESVLIHRSAGQESQAKLSAKRLKEQHGGWLAATRALYASKGQPWPLDPPRKNAKKSNSPSLKGRK
jgi:glycosyltransferase involved in cell wall biosynthesis/GT2 family glycosyltransferase